MLRTTVAGLEFPVCIYNASGPRTQSVEALQKIGGSRAGCILSKSVTLEKQQGNDLPRSIQKIELGAGYCEGSINSEGLPNEGVDYFLQEENLKALSAYGKPFILSLSGLSLKDNIEMLNRALLAPGVSAIELNLACPNIPGKPVIAYDFEQMDDVLKNMCSHPEIKSGKKILGVKLAPYFDRPHVERAVSIIIQYPVRFIVSINTIGNALFVDAEAECASISPKGGFGGLGGGYVKHTALANVRMLCTILAEKGKADAIDVVGVGGVASGTDAFELILCGAKAVQVGTCHWTEGAGCFDRIAGELEAIMSRKGYKSIEQFRGKLKPYQEHDSKVLKKGKVRGATAPPSSASSSSSLTLLPVVVVFLLAVIVALLGDKMGVLVAISRWEGSK